MPCSEEEMVVCWQYSVLSQQPCAALGIPCRSLRACCCGRGDGALVLEMHDCYEGHVVPSVKDVEDTNTRMAGEEVTKKMMELLCY